MNSVTEDYIEEMLRAIDKLRDKINKYHPLMILKSLKV